MGLAACALSLTACASGEPDSLSVAPASLDWGEVDFQEEMPTEGYDETTVSITNEAEEEVTVEVVELDLDHLCSPGIPSTPFEIGTLSEGQSLSFFVAVCEYSPEAGERDSEQTGTMVFRSSAGGQAEVGWSFTPVERL